MQTLAEALYSKPSAPAASVEAVAPAAQPVATPDASQAAPPANEVANEAPAPASPPPDTLFGAPAAEQPGDYQLDVPVGVTIDADLLSTATPVLRNLGLSDEQASKLVPLANKVQERFLSDLQADHTKLRTDWKRNAEADATIGGENWKESVRIAGSALTIGGAGPGSEVRKLLDETGLGDHPAFIRLFRNLGLRLGDGQGQDPGPKTLAEALYGKNRT